MWCPAAMTGASTRDQHAWLDKISLRRTTEVTLDTVCVMHVGRDTRQRNSLNILFDNIQFQTAECRGKRRQIEGGRELFEDREKQVGAQACKKYTL